jgi:hypothetical protein
MNAALTAGSLLHAEGTGNVPAGVEHVVVAKAWSVAPPQTAPAGAEHEHAEQSRVSVDDA